MYTGEFNPDTLEVESRLRQQLRDVLLATPDVRDADLINEVQKMKKELADFERSFDLYWKASRELNDAYAKTHPEEADIHIHDAGKVARWAADIIRAAFL